VRWVAVLALQAPASPSTGCARRPSSASRPPPARAPSPSSRSSRGRLPLAAGGASAPVRPQGAPRRQGKPQPGQVGRECSGQAGSSCQGYPRYARRYRGLDSARPAAGLVAAAWPENGLGPVPQPHRWRSRCPRRRSLPGAAAGGQATQCRRVPCALSRPPPLAP